MTILAQGKPIEDGHSPLPLIIYLRSLPFTVSRGNKIVLSVLGVIVIVILGGFLYATMTSGLESPLSVIMSSSMQHDNDESRIGIIDTGDVMIIKNPDKVDIHSYIEGTVDGYKSFGDYGSVIIYNRGDDVNPVIHRAIIWLDYRSGTWSAPSLAEYQGQWKCTSGTDYMNLSGVLTFTGITKSNKTVSINLNELDGKSGYLTMGDNPVTNKDFDQAGGIVSYPIGKDDLKAVAMYEIPWMGVVKVFMTENKKANLSHVPNSIYCLVMLFVMVFALIYCCDFYYTHKDNEAKREEIRRLLDKES